MDIKLQVPLDSLFPEELATFERLSELLQQLKRTDTLLSIGRVNLILSNPGDASAVDRQRYIAQTFLPVEQLSRLDSFAQHNGLERISLLERPALLELARWVTLICPDNPNALTTFNSSEIRTTFIKCAIISGRLWADRIYKHGIKSENFQYLPLLRKNIEHNRRAEPYWRSIARGKFLFTSCMEEYNRNTDSDFRRYTGISINEYYLCALIILSQYTDVTPEKVLENQSNCGLFCVNNMLDNATDEAKRVMTKYLACESQTPEKLHSYFMADRSLLDPDVEFDASAFIQKPLIISDGDTKMGVAIDLVSYNKKVSMAPHYILQNEYKDHPERLEKLKKDLGHAFEEKYVHYLLSSMFSNVQGSIVVPSPVVYQATGGRDEHQLCDFAIIQGRDLALIEAKAILLSDDKVQIEDPSVYKREILNKYGRTSEKKSKGVGQLTNAIKKIAVRGWQSDQFDISSIRYVYPILLFYDGLMPTFGHVELLASKFLKALEPDFHYLNTSHFQKGRLVCTPLTLMSIDELENLHDSPKHFSFFNLLADYTRDFNTRQNSLSHFIASQPKASKYKFYYNIPMMDRLTEELHSAGNLLFRDFEFIPKSKTID